MKKLISVALVILTLFAVSCKEEGLKVSDYSVADKKAELSALELLAETIIYEKDGENVLNSDYFEYYFGDSALLEGISDYIYYTSATTSVCEVGIFKVKDGETKTALENAFTTRKENLISTYENYSKADVQIAENMKNGSFDDVVWFVMTTDNASVTEVIE